MMKNKRLSIILLYVICYLISMAFSYTGHYYLSGVTLGVSAIGLYLYEYIKTKNPISLKGLFSLFWIGGQSISCLKLSALQKPWRLLTWISFFLVYISFYISYEFVESKYHNRRNTFNGNKRLKMNVTRLFYSITGITLISILCFTIEALVLRFIPLFSKEPHAYSYFHISGVHYFTVACVLVPALSVIFFKCCHRIPSNRRILVILSTIVSMMIPVLCVSRFQLIMMIILAIITYFSLDGKLKLSHILIVSMIFLIGILPIYFLLTVARHHDVEYLNGIFEMKNARTPIFITQPYMYIANNYDNFNCLIEELPGFTFGLRMLFSIWVFTGLKFVFPGLVNLPIFVTKMELSTVTMVYDAYYDFGIIGIVGFSLLLGGICSKLSDLVKKSQNPLSHLLFAQMAIYLILSFFTTWFSNPTTWFWYGITALIFWFVGWN